MNGKGIAFIIALALIIFGATAPLDHYSLLHMGSLCAGVVLGALAIKDAVAKIVH